MKTYSQRDPRWSQNKIGQTNLTIGRFGCTITSIADLSTYFGDNLTPADVANKIQFTSDGLILWNSCKFGHFEFERRSYALYDFDIRDALKDPDKAVILEVEHDHWVAATGISILGGYNIADPWFGDFSTTRRYRQITGAAFFHRV